MASFVSTGEKPSATAASQGVRFRRGEVRALRAESESRRDSRSPRTASTNRNCARANKASTEGP